MTLRLIAIIVVLCFIFGGILISGCAGGPPARPYGYGDVER